MNCWEKNHSFLNCDDCDDSTVTISDIDLSSSRRRIEAIAEYIKSNNECCIELEFVHHDSNNNGTTTSTQFLDVSTSSSSSLLTSSSTNSSIMIDFCDYIRHYQLILDAIAMNYTIEIVYFHRNTLYSDNEFSQVLCEILIEEILHLPTLTELHFDLCSKINKAGNYYYCPKIFCNSFRNCKSKSITRLWFRGCKLGQLEHMIMSLPSSSTGSCNSDDQKKRNSSSSINCLEDFFNSIVHNFPSLKILDLLNNDLDHRGCKMLWNAISSCGNNNKKKNDNNIYRCSLERLDLEGNYIGDIGCYVLSNLIASTNCHIIALKGLYLCNNEITDDGIQILVTNGLCCYDYPNYTLEELSIYSNDISSKQYTIFNRGITKQRGWKYILHGLQNNHIMALQTFNCNDKEYYSVTTYENGQWRKHQQHSSSRQSHHHRSLHHHHPYLSTNYHSHNDGYSCHNDNDEEFCYYNEIQYYLKLNKVGRGYFIHYNDNNNNVIDDEENIFDNKKAKKEKWISTLMKVNNYTDKNDNIDFLYYMISNNPEIFLYYLYE